MCKEGQENGLHSHEVVFELLPRERPSVYLQKNNVWSGNLNIQKVLGQHDTRWSRPIRREVAKVCQLFTYSRGCSWHSIFQFTPKWRFPVRHKYTK